MIEVPTENLFRGVNQAPTTRDDAPATDGTLMYGHFSRFDTWYEIDSWFEGQFLERTAVGAFKKTIRENRDAVKVQFDHGYDYNVGDALLGPIDVLREDGEGPYFEVPLLDTDYNRDRILPMLQGRLMNGDMRGSLLGVSFRFRVTRDEWVEPSKASDHNPDKLPERTIKEVRLYEFGPVVYPANPDADVAVRSLTDHFMAKDLARRGSAERAARQLFPAPPEGAPGAPAVAPPEWAPDQAHAQARRQWLASRFYS